MAALPTPHTTTDMLLVAVHEQLVGLRQDIADQSAVRGGGRTPSKTQEQPTGQVELTEPKTPAARKSTRRP